MIYVGLGKVRLMFALEKSSDPLETAGAQFRTTAWSIVQAAGDPEAPDAASALAELCSVYWRPIYAYLRRAGRPPHDAQDITQDFFCALMRREAFARLAPNFGRFRSFLLTSLKNYVSDFDRKARSQKRGGGLQFISHDQVTAEEARIAYTHGTDRPEQRFDQRWAQLIVQRAEERLKATYHARGEGERFDILRGFLTGELSNGDYAACATALKSNTPAVHTAISRLRRRFRDALYAEVSTTVLDPAEVEPEMRHLVAMMAEGSLAE
jgi:RNA polymerase sigma factor (sigma-70 family)